jgi:hypothetical protein
MDLTDTQRQTVRDWVAAGAGLSDVQKRLRAELGIAMTYMEVRLLVLELGVAVKDKPAAKPLKAAPPPKAGAAAAQADDDLGDDLEDGQAGRPASTSKVHVTLDRVVQAGAVVSGGVTFSDGTKARWFLDQYGRLGLDPAKKGHRPPAADMQEFQVQLRELLAQRGYA